jgi:hypothetical protein
MNLHTLDGDFDNIQAIIDPAILLPMPVLSFIFVIVQCMWSFWVGANLCRFYPNNQPYYYIITFTQYTKIRNYFFD